MIKTLSSISEIQVGFQSREGIREDPNGSHSIIQARDFDMFRQIQWCNLTRFTPRQSPSRYVVNQGDVLFLAKGQENFAYCIDRDLNNTLAGNTFNVIRPNKDMILPAYLEWWLNHSPAQEYITVQRGGSSIPYLSISALVGLEVQVPSFPIQEKILKLDALRKKETDLTRSLLKKKSTLIEAVCLKAITE